MFTVLRRDRATGVPSNCTEVDTVDSSKTFLIFFVCVGVFITAELGLNWISDDTAQCNFCWRGDFGGVVFELRRTARGLARTTVIASFNIASVLAGSIFMLAILGKAFAFEVSITFLPDLRLKKPEPLEWDDGELTLGLPFLLR